MRRAIATPIVVAVLVALGWAAAPAQTPSPTAEYAPFCETESGTPEGRGAFPSIRADEVAVNGGPAALWLQRYTFGPGEKLEGCFTGSTLFWVEDGAVRLTVIEGCYDETPDADDPSPAATPGATPEATPEPSPIASSGAGTPAADTPNTCATGTLDLAEDATVLLTEAGVTIENRSPRARAVVVMAAVEGDPPLNCNGRPCPRGRTP